MAAKDVEAGRAHVLLSIRDRMTQGLKLAEKRFQQFGRYAATTGAVMSGGAFATLAWPIKLSADMEQASVAMEVFLGSASAAKKMISDIEMMAAKTPFRFDELKDAANLLLGFGATGAQVLPMLNLLGDASRGNSESFGRLALAFGQTMAKGRLMGQEVLQMTEQGFNPLFWISKQTGKSMETLMKEMEAGQISFSMLVGAFQTATGPMGKFNGMMAKQSQTLTGLTSSFLDFFSMIARAVGDTLVPMFKRVLTAANSIAIGFTAIIKANSGLVGTIAKVILAVGIFGGMLTTIGAAAFAFSFVIGLMGSGLAFVVGLFTTMFSPLGALIAIFGVAGVAAMVYRKAIAEAFRGLLIWAQPVIDAFYRIFGAAAEAVGGIVSALASGNIQLAGAIALGALKLMFLQALIEIPGMGRMLATGFGQALLAGRWDLMAAIAMANVKLQLLTGWNAIANIWSASLTGLGTMWDMAIHGIRTGWNQASTGLASGMLWVVGQIRIGVTAMINVFDQLYTGALLAANQIKSLFGDQEAAIARGKALLDESDKRQNARNNATAAMNIGSQKNLIQDSARTQAGINTDLQTSMTGRVNGEQAARAGRAQQEADVRSQIQGLNGQANKAAADAGVTTAEQAAKKAQEELKALIAQTKGGKGPDFANRVVPGLASKTGLPNVESRGSFTAAGALALGGRSNAQEATARNTAMANKLLRVIADKKGPTFA